MSKMRTIFIGVLLVGICSGLPTLLTNKKECKSGLDVVAILDGSESISAQNFLIMKTALERMVQDLRLDQHDTRFSVILYSSVVTYVIPFSNNELDLMLRIRGLVQPMDGTQTHLGISEMNQMFKNSGRPNVHRVGIVLTDGNSKDRMATIEASKQSAMLNINMFAVGTNDNVDVPELKAIATSDSRVVTVERIGEIYEHIKVLLKTCLDTRCKDYLDVVTVIDGSETISNVEFQSVKNAVKEFIVDLSQKNKLSRFSLVMFSSNTSRVIDFTNDKNDLLSQIDSLDQPNDEANIAAALEKTNDLILNTGREGVSKIIIVITDGYSKSSAQTSAHADQAKKMGINVFSVGISDRRHSGELSVIASDIDKALVLDDFKKLSKLLMEDVQKACKEADNMSSNPTPRTNNNYPTESTTTSRPTPRSSWDQTTRTNIKYPSDQETTSGPTSRPNWDQTTRSTPQHTPKTQQPSDKTTRPRTDRVLPDSNLDPNGLCNNCTIENGVGFAEVPTSCQKFVRCVFNVDMLIKVIIQDCAPGLFWDQQALTCNYATEVDCTKDPCFGKTDGDYVNPINCREYYTCVEEVSFEKCCLPNHAFSTASGKCEPSSSCQDPCKWGNPETQCTRRAISGDRHNYEETVDGITWHNRSCAAGSMYNQEKCKCADLDEDFKVPEPAPQARDCQAVVYLPFTMGTYDESGNFNYVQNNGVQVEDGKAYFDGQSSLRIPRFANVDFGTTLTIRLKYKLDGVASGQEAIVTNGDCGEQESVSIIADQSRTVFGLRSENQQKTTIDISATSDWNDVEYKVSNGMLNSSVNGRQENKMVDGIVIKRHCGLQIGRGPGLQNFKGWIDEISVFMCSF